MPPSTPLSALYMFQRTATTKVEEHQTFFGSVAGKLVLSVDPKHPAQTTAESRPRKRARDASREEAELAVDRLRISGAEAESISDESFVAAKSAVESMLKVRGGRGEQVLESWCVSIRKAGQWGANR